jgi:hypothetical protein
LLSCGEFCAQFAVLWRILCTVGCPVGNSMTGFCKRRQGFAQQKERIRKHRVEYIFYASVLKIRDGVLLHVTRKCRIYINVNEIGRFLISPTVEEEGILTMVKH